MEDVSLRDLCEYFSEYCREHEDSGKETDDLWLDYLEYVEEEYGPDVAYVLSGC